MAYPINYAGKLNPNEIYVSIYNMIISQQVFADNIKNTKLLMLFISNIIKTYEDDYEANK